jgi:DNA-binding NarL/FixJ family response regulator
MTRRLIERFAVPNADPDAFGDLTDRELEVVRLVARGMSNAEIAAEASLSEATVKTHLTNVLRKLGLRDRTQLVVRAYEAGFVRPGV